MKPTLIRLKKRKFIRVAVISLIFFIMSLLFVAMPNLFLSKIISSKIVILVFGILGLLFFGLALMYSYRKLTRKNLGLLIDDEGLIDSSNAYRFGLIEWQDIKGFKRILISNSNLILIETDQPHKYLQKIQSPVFHKSAEQYLNLYGTPLIIWCSLLDSDPLELENLLNSKLKSKK
ncbi:MAG: STM3941 family protein [Weeksellaceae bacterium]